MCAPCPEERRTDIHVANPHELTTILFHSLHLLCGSRQHPLHNAMQDAETSRVSPSARRASGVRAPTSGWKTFMSGHASAAPDTARSVRITAARSGARLAAQAGAAPPLSLPACSDFVSIPAWTAWATACYSRWCVMLINTIHYACSMQHQRQS